MKNIKLLKPHRHDGIDFAAGQILTLPIQQAWLAEWLVAHEIAEPLTEPTPKAPGAAPEA